MNLNNLTSIQMDVLREIGNIGAGNAATSMAKLINKKVDMEVPLVNVVAFDEVMDLIGGPEQLIVANYFQIQGEAPGNVYFILSMDEAQAIVRQFTGISDLVLFNDNYEPNEIAISAIQEIGNILTGSYLSALSDFTNINMQPSIPYLSIDMAGAILAEGLIELSQSTDYAIIIDTKINDSDLTNGITGQFFLLPAPETFTKLFQALGITNYE